MGIFEFFKPKSRADMVLDKYYKNFSRKPYISPDRDFDQWEEMVTTFPNMLVHKEMMIAYNDGLLPGHVYMLYWIDKINRSRVPVYFEYEYGINFYAEKDYLQKLGFLDSNGIVSDKGHQAIQSHYEVIEKRHPEMNAKKAESIKNNSALSRVIPSRESDSVEIIPKDDYCQFKKEIEFLNDINNELCKKYRLPKMVIIFNRLCYGTGFHETHYVFTPFTKTKRPSKYPLSVRYSYAQSNNDTPAVFGNIYYLQNGTIGKAEEIFWIKQHEGYVINLGQTKGELVLKNIEHLTPLNGERTIIVKENKK